ncbi:hypothetical protein B296_00035861 [Ensete ventricosum]|uniref:Uncharacterized protein n=1 Tax=Ensete ventricosum TaxID=4639 RepID=A0A426YR58_ENSVE|nr:hypothetical protein B296_00035861 [Ensete ventricosum]
MYGREGWKPRLLERSRTRPGVTHVSCGSPTGGRHGSRPSLGHGQTAPMCSSLCSRRSPPRCCPRDLVGGSPVPPPPSTESKERVTSPCRLWGRRARWGSPVPPQAVAESKDRVTSPCRLWGRRTYAKAMRSAPPTPVGGNEGPRDPYERPRCGLSVLSMITTLGTM